MNGARIQMQIASKITGYSHLMVAFSGGLDSTVLLHALIELRIKTFPDLKLHAVHVHHGLSPHADSWADHCKLVCREWMVQLNVVKVNIDSKLGGVEAAARNKRYWAIANTMNKQDILLTAHHLDDQSETFFLALKRGSGPAGLSAMASCITFFNSQHIRPLLDISRAQLEEYAKYKNIKWIEDYSNQDNRFDRNFLRLEVIPNLRNRWPHFTKAVARSAKLCAEQEDLLDELLQESLKALTNKDTSININGLLQISEAKRYAILRRWIAYFKVMPPSKKQLQRVWFEVAMARLDAKPQLKLGEYQIRRYHQHLYLLPMLTVLKEKVIQWNPDTILLLPDGLGTLQLDHRGICVRQPKVNEVVSLRFTAHSRICIINRTHSKQIKKIWREHNIPPWERERTPMLYYGEELIAILGICITKNGEAMVHEPFWKINWTKNICKSIIL
ncbi:tRNA lysidine(34) synthetase TilS [Candidatus Profftia tarda]|uniref:tRNA(Ile)-lysidine synthase n=1 Tax=Candidatus Profftia tarda TaxID=1177216 RepID=A0A8E4GHW2_9ENTR|nr:tRNA lysidine(34) synthetase TilS [Candidatus Profftia tarda]CAD6511742.1 tRNA(Ile)-lysidine synthase [Candidatus Profftia tarda]